MKKVKYLILIIFFLNSCKTTDKIEGSRISLKCTKELNNYFKMDSCEKIDFLLRKKNLPNDCFQKIAEDMYALTGIESSMEVGFLGIYYSSDSIRLSDIKRWKEFLKCK